MGQKPHGEYLLPVVMDGGDKSEIVGDIAEIVTHRLK
jgi:hypothetical protein